MGNHLRHRVPALGPGHPSRLTDEGDKLNDCVPRRVQAALALS
jgi:hypothetical protein